MKQMIHMTNPATSWENATPVGNGSMGAMLFGDTDCERIYLNEETIWSDNGDDGLSPGFRDKIDRIRQLFLAGKPAAADAWAAENLADDLRRIASYETAGVLSLAFRTKAAPEDYRRDLHLQEGTALVSYTKNGAGYTHEAFASYPRKLLVYRVSAADKTSFCLRFRREGMRNASYEDGILQFICETAYGQHAFCVGVRIDTDGTLTGDAEALTVENAADTTLYISIVTQFRDADFVQTCRTRLAGADRGYRAIRAEHVEDFSALMNRSEITLEGDGAVESLPVAQRLQRLRENKDACDPSLAALYFTFGKYLLVSSSRPGCLPANLQGVWAEKMENPWNADYHTNINLQMNYWHCETANLGECAQPLFDYMNNCLLPSGQRTARTNYGMRGMVVHHVSDMYGFTAPADGLWGLWPLGGAWLAYHLWEHYLYTGDKAFLSETAYEYIKNCALFFIDYLFDDGSGRLLSGPSTSPENTYLADGESVYLCLSPTMDVEIIGGLLRFYIETEALLERDADTAALAKKTLARIPPLQIGKHGQLREWLEDYEEPEPGHRHISHAFALYPGCAITRATPALYRAIGVTLERRLAHGGGHTGWSRAWLLNLYARLRNSEAFDDSLRALLTKSTLDNLFDTHPPLQIDGNFGGAAAVCEALLQSHEGFLSLLPAVPSHWSGSFRDLLARGNIAVSCTFEKGRVLECAMLPAFDGELRIELPAAQRGAFVNGKEADENGLYVFPCNAGERARFRVTERNR